MTSLLAITLPIFLLIAVGYGATRWGAVTPAFIQDLGGFVLNFALPALVLHALLAQDLRQTFNAAYLAVYAGGSLIVFAAVFFLFRSVLKRGLSHAAIAALGGSAANSGFIGFPVATLAIGTPALTALPLCMLVEVVLIIPLALGLAEAGRGGGKPARTIAFEALLRLARMPLLLAIALGIALSALGLQLPAALSTAVGMLADASAACALFVVGGTLAGVAANAFAADLVWISVAKLVLHPLLVALGFFLVDGVPPGLVAAGIVFASAPMITAYPIFGQRFGLGPLAAAALVIATAASFLTMTAVLAMLGVDATPPLTSLWAEPHTVEDYASIDQGD